MRPALRLPALVALASVLGACTASMGAPSPVAEARPLIAPDVLRRYAAATDEPFPVEAVDPRDLKARNLRQLVDYPTKEPPGTLVVDPYERFLYLVMEGGKAMRYGVGGRQGRVRVHRRGDCCPQGVLAALDADPRHAPARPGAQRALGRRNAGR